MKGRKLIRRILISLAVLSAAYVILIGDYSVIKVGSLYLEKEKLKSDLESMKEEREDLVEECDEIREEKEELERLAREKLGMVKPGERLYKVIVTDKPIDEEGEVGEDPHAGERSSQRGENASAGTRENRPDGD